MYLMTSVIATNNKISNTASVIYITSFLQEAEQPPLFLYYDTYYNTFSIRTQVYNMHKYTCVTLYTLPIAIYLHTYYNIITRLRKRPQQNRKEQEP